MEPEGYRFESWTHKGVEPSLHRDVDAVGDLILSRIPSKAPTSGG